MSHSRVLQEQYSWTSRPLICCAPMRMITGSELAAEVSLAGGIGFLGAGTDLSGLSADLEQAQTLVDSLSKRSDDSVLPIGVGFINWGADFQLAVDAVTRFVPAAVWFFAPKATEDLGRWARSIREVSKNKTKVWVQVGSVQGALDAAKLSSPDVLVIQGSDAGGHGLAHSSSIITLLPECVDALRAAGYGDIPLVAAGGISDGRGAAAVLALGASSICMGTRFLSAPEAKITAGYRRAVLDASDGGISTVRTKLYDQLRGTTGWPDAYNGRGIINASFRDAQGGMLDQENKKLYDEALEIGDVGWGKETGRITTYAGSGVGLVRNELPARKIVEEVINDAAVHLKAALDSL